MLACAVLRQPLADAVVAPAASAARFRALRPLLSTIHTAVVCEEIRCGAACCSRRRRTRSAAVARSWRAAEPAAPHLDGAGEPFPMLCPAAGDSPNSCVNLRQKSRSVFMRKLAKMMTTESALPAPPTASGCSRRVISVLTPPSCVGHMPRAIVMVPCSCAANMQMVAVCDLPPSAPSGAAAPACSARGGAPSGRDTGAAPARVCAVHPPRQQRVARDGQSARSRHDKHSAGQVR